jgi:hypothetical protein
MAQNIQAMNLNISESHLFIDCSYVSEDALPALTVALPIMAEDIPDLAQWKTVTVVGTGFPKILDVPGASNAVLLRTEWELWKGVRNDFVKLVRRIDFGDYTITHPELVDFDPVKMKLSAKIIYTTDSDWLVYKGRTLKQLGGQQTHAMCADLIKRPEFKGAAFSMGDKYIADCAVRAVSCGNPKTWKHVGTNHHITLVAGQLASQP